MSFEANESELMIWGYACKLFRDDEKALLVDSGKHLIPWMGDDKLLIDRYDGRGTLYDLVSHEPVEGAWDGLTIEEKEMENKCDNERYRALYEEEESKMFKEEEEKRNQGKYGQVAYSYEGGAVATCEPPSTDVKAFNPPPGLELPSELVKPESMKHHAIIIKTAAFIAQQGSQMEILMRLKQQGNIKFNFLMHGDTLHDYYKFLLNLIKAGSYVPSEADTSCLDEEEPEGEHYLHPSLLPSSPQVDPKNPPPLTRLIISKMIKYIVKNGLIFEEAIKKLEDSRFSFVDSSDPYYNYYREQVTSAFKLDDNMMVKEEKKESKSTEKEENDGGDEPEEDDEEEEKKAIKRKLTPVCFSLKKPKDSESLEVSTALPQEDSTDDEEEESRASPDPPPPPPASRISKMKSKHERESTDRDKSSPDNLQKERKAKVAQFLKGLKYK